MLNETAILYTALERYDRSEYQRSARILQSMWRAEQGYQIGNIEGPNGSRPLGTRLEMPWAQESLANYLNDNIRKVVREEVLDPVKSRGRLYGKPRIFNDLLSSQPLCFNLFAELKENLPLAAQVMGLLTNGLVDSVASVEFEWSPGRGDPRLTGDRSAFDVYVAFSLKGGGKGFIGIEVKYHENLIGDPSPHRERYDQISDQMGCFKGSTRGSLKTQPLQQIWRDHMLAGIHKTVNGFDEGFFVFLYPERNNHCADAVENYKDCLTNTDTFASWTLEEVAGAVKKCSRDEWIDLFIDRYLNFDKVTSGSKKET